MTSPTEKPGHAEISTPPVVLLEDDTPQKPCSVRIVDALGQGWCILPVNHEGACHRTPSQFGPERPPPDRKLMGGYLRDVSQKWHQDEATRAQWYARWGLLP